MANEVLSFLQTKEMQPVVNLQENNKSYQTLHAEKYCHFPVGNRS